MSVNLSSLTSGPQVDPLELMLQFKLLDLQSIISSFSFIKTDVEKEGPSHAEWKTVMSKEDPRVMGRWNVRCRVIQIIQGLAFWKKASLHDTFLSWVNSGCGNAWKSLGRESLCL